VIFISKRASSSGCGAGVRGRYARSREIRTPESGRARGAREQRGMNNGLARTRHPVTRADTVDCNRLRHNPAAPARTARFLDEFGETRCMGDEKDRRERAVAGVSGNVAIAGQIKFHILRAVSRVSFLGHRGGMIYRLADSVATDP